MSELHCNFMINDGMATAADLEALGELVREKVQKATGINLQFRAVDLSPPGRGDLRLDRGFTRSIRF
jgi:UDP-N-acetylmuramate dehydrogenase